jgi:hypothetical protein
MSGGEWWRYKRWGRAVGRGQVMKGAVLLWLCEGFGESDSKVQFVIEEWMVRGEERGGESME